MANFSNLPNHGVPFLQAHAAAFPPSNTEGNTPSQAVHAQNMAHFQQNSLIPALDPLQFLHPEDPNAQHVASLLQQLQAVGYSLPMPPPLPPHVYQHVPTPSNAASTSATPRGDSICRVMDAAPSDREEGELSDTDMVASPDQTSRVDPGSGVDMYRPQYDSRTAASPDSRITHRTSLIPPGRAPSPTTTSPQSTQKQPPPSESPLSAQGRAANHMVEQIIADLGVSSAGQKASQPLAQQHDNARKFISLLHFHGYALKDLAEETSYFNKTDQASLAQLYGGLTVDGAEMSQQLPRVSDASALREPTSNKQSTRTDGLLREPPKGPAALSPTPSQSSGPIQPASTAAAKVASKAPPGQTPTGTPTRAEYLAKLRAARLKVGAKTSDPAAKSDTDPATPTAHPPVVIAQPTAPAPKPDVESATAAATSQADASNTQSESSNSQDDLEARKRRQTELLQQKLAELRAKQNRVQTPSATAVNAQPQEGLQMQKGTLQRGNAQSPISAAQATSPTTTIPGLFMQGAMGGPFSPSQTTRASPTQQPTAIYSDSMDLDPYQMRSRKRPVAADFDDVTPESFPRPSKRPTFGDDPYAEDEQMIIEVSDDESDDGGVNVAEGIEHLITSVTKPGAFRQEQATGAKQTALREHGALSNFPAHGTFSPGSSAFNTPGGTPASISQLSRMDADIARLKAKIQASEAAKRKREESRPLTPIKRIDPATTDVYSLATGLMSVETPQAKPMPQDSVAVQATPASTSSPRSESPAEHRLRRQSEIQTIDARLASNNSRMESLRREMEALEAENNRRLEEKEALTKELQVLGVADVEGMDNNAMRAIRDEIRDQHEHQHVVEKAQSPMASLHSNEEQASVLLEPNGADKPVVGEQEALEKLREKLAGDSLKPSDLVATEILAATQKFYQEPNIAHSNSLFLSAPPAPPGLPSDMTPELPRGNDTIQDATTIAADDATAAGGDDDDSEDFYSELPAQTSLLQTSFSNNTIADDLGISDDDDFYSPRPAAAQQVGTAEESHCVVSEPQENLPIPEAQVTSPTHGEDLAFESIAEVRDKVRVQDSPGHAAALPVSLLSSGVASPESGVVESGRYRSPIRFHSHGSTPAPMIVSLRGSRSPTWMFRGADKEEGELEEEEEEEEDYEPPAADNGTHGSNLAFSAPNKPVVYAGSSSRQTAATATDIPVADDLAPELQTSLPLGKASRQQTPAANEEQFRPYESSLKQFKSYRYHPQFAENVQGGVRSMTYSHNIDPEKMLCPFEAENGICNDRNCRFQHYKDMELTDDMILYQLGTKNPGRTEEEQSRWNDGLREVLKRLREAQVQDPNIVLQEIAKYRGIFLGDTSRILDLKLE